MSKKQDLCYKSTAIEILGITKKQFESLGIEPDKVVNNPRYASAAPSQLFDRKKIQRKTKTKKVIAMREAYEARKAKRAKGKDWSVVFNNRYQSKNEAIPKAAELLFNMNRYAKHNQCSEKNKEEIYKLKNEFIKFLYQEGTNEMIYVHLPFIHKIELPRKKCFSCDGSGFWDLEFKEDCIRCDGSGVFSYEKILKFYVFGFDVQGKRYTWHQPSETINYNVELSDRVEDLNETEIKPLQISSSKFSEGKALIKWILEKEKTND